MTLLAVVYRCSLRRQIERASACGWLWLHLALYAALYVGTMLIQAVGVPGGVGDFMIGVVVRLAWGMPLHVAVLVVAAGALVFLRLVGGQRWYWFRLAAVGVFMLPAAWLAWCVSSGDETTLMAVLPMHLLMGLLAVQPDTQWANTDPSPELHWW